MSGAPSESGALWLTEEEIGAAINLNEAIEALEQGIRAEALGQAANIDKALGVWGGAASMHALGSFMPERGYVGWKTWANTPKGAAAVFSLFSAENGALLALMEAGVLGKLRTSGISGLATRTLADPAADEMALIGTGSQALMQVAAIAATRTIRRVRVFSRTPERRAAFVESARRELPFEVEDSPSLEAALKGMPIVTVITRTTEPFLDADLLASGAHVNAAGAILPANAELLPNVLARASLVAVDSLGNAQKASREFRDHYGADPAGWSAVKTLGQILVSGADKSAKGDLTVFKPMGMGLSDLSVAAFAYERCVAMKAGRRVLGTPVPTPRWTPAA